MTVYCSNLPNDQDMIRALGSLALPLPLDIGDCCFSGVDNSNNPIVIAGERKKVGDLAQCIINGRYISQAQKSVELGADRLFLVVEGNPLRSSPDDGVLEQVVWGVNNNTGHRCQLWKPVLPTIQYSHWCAYLAELQLFCGVLVFRTADVGETASVIKSLYAMFQHPTHQSLNVIFKTQGSGSGVLLYPPSFTRRVAVELKGVGWERSKAVCEKFKTVEEMVQATEKDWEKVEGIGKKLAKSIVAELHGGSK